MREELNNFCERCKSFHPPGACNFNNNNIGFSDKDWSEALERKNSIVEKELKDGSTLRGKILETEISPDYRVVEKICTVHNINIPTEKKDDARFAQELTFIQPSTGKTFTFNDILPMADGLRVDLVPDLADDKHSSHREFGNVGEFSAGGDIVKKKENKYRKIKYGRLSSIPRVVGLFHETGHVWVSEKTRGAKFLLAETGSFGQAVAKRTREKINKKLTELFNYTYQINVQSPEFIKLKELIGQAAYIEATKRYPLELISQNLTIEELEKIEEQLMKEIVDSMVSRFENELRNNPDLLENCPQDWHRLVDDFDKWSLTAAERLPIFKEIEQRIKQEKMIRIRPQAVFAPYFDFPERVLIDLIKIWASEERNAWAFAIRKILEIRNGNFDLAPGYSKKDLLALANRGLATYQRTLKKDILIDDEKEKDEFLRKCHPFSNANITN